MTVLLAVFRRPEMLKALLCERRDGAEREASHQDQPYAERMVALSAVPETMCAWRDADIRAWRSLSKVPNVSARATRAIVRALLSTVVDPDYSGPTESNLDFGGKPVDLRPLLCNPDGEERVLKELGEAIPKEDGASELPSWHWSRRQEIAAMPQGFRRHFLWGLSLDPWEHVQLMLAMFESLSLASHPALSLALARLSAVGSRGTILWWCDVIAEVPESGRIQAVEAILVAGAQASMPDAASREAMVSEDWSVAAECLAVLGDS